MLSRKLFSVAMMCALLELGGGTPPMCNKLNPVEISIEGLAEKLVPGL